MKKYVCINNIYYSMEEKEEQACKDCKLNDLKVDEDCHYYLLDENNKMTNSYRVCQIYSEYTLTKVTDPKELFLCLTKQIKKYKLLRSDEE